MGPWQIYMFLPDIFLVLFYFLIYFQVENGELWMVVILFSHCVSVFYLYSDLIWWCWCVCFMFPFGMYSLSVVLIASVMILFI